LPPRPQAYLGSTKLQPKDLGPKNKTAYSNLGLGLLGQLLGEIHGTSYTELIEGLILKPLEMNDTFVATPAYQIPPELKARLAQGHAQAHWSPDTPTRLQAAMKLAAQAHYKNTIGLAWILNQGTLQHDGGTGGFLSSLKINVSKQTAFVTLQNGFSTGEERIHKGDYTPVKGLWIGTLPGKQKLRLAFHILSEGSAVLYSLNQGSTPLISGMSEFKDRELFIRFPAIEGTLQAKLIGEELVGTWSQGQPLQLTLTSTNQLPKKLQKTLQKRIPDDLDSLVGFWSGEIAVSNLLVQRRQIVLQSSVSRRNIFSRPCRRQNNQRNLVSRSPSKARS